MLIRRLIGSLVLIWLVLTLTFALVRAAPGDPASLLIPASASASDAARLRAELGLDKPLAVQYARWGRALVTGDLGESFALRRPVVAGLPPGPPPFVAPGGASPAPALFLRVAARQCPGTPPPFRP